jgi:hypothetical protein
MRRSMDGDKITAPFFALSLCLFRSLPRRRLREGGAIRVLGLNLCGFATLREIFLLLPVFSPAKSVVPNRPGSFVAYVNDRIHENY